MQPPSIHEIRSRREQYYVELRAQRRADLTAKRRAINSLTAKAEERVKRAEETEEEALRRIAAQLERDEDVDSLWETLGELKERLSQGMTPVTTSIALGLHKPLLRIYAANKRYEHVLIPLLGCVANLAAGPHASTVEVARSGWVEVLCAALAELGLDACEQAVLGLGNFAGDSVELRDLVVKYKGHVLISQLVMTAEMLPLGLTRLSAWTLSNLTRGTPPLPPSACQVCLPVLSELIASNDELTLTSALFAVSFIAYGGTEYIQLILNEKGLLETVIRVGERFQSEARLPSLKVIGNIAAGDHIHTQHLIDIPIFPLLAKSINSSNPAVRKEVFFTLSNLCAGTLPQIDALLRDKIAKELVAGTEDYDVKVRKEATWAVYNVSKLGSEAQKSMLRSLGLFNSLKNSFLFPELDLRLTIENMLTTALSFASQLAIRTELEASGCWDEIERLIHCPNSEISELASHLLEWEWVPDESADEDEPPES